MDPIACNQVQANLFINMTQVLPCTCWKLSFSRTKKHDMICWKQQCTCWTQTIAYLIRNIVHIILLVIELLAGKYRLDTHVHSTVFVDHVIVKEYNRRQESSSGSCRLFTACKGHMSWKATTREQQCRACTSRQQHGNKGCVLQFCSCRQDRHQSLGYYQELQDWKVCPAAG